MHHFELPMVMREPFYRFFAYRFDVDLEEMRYPLSHYRNLSEFLSRPLKDGVRPVSVDTELVAPVDALLTHFGLVEADGTLEQIKV